MTRRFEKTLLILAFWRKQCCSCFHSYTLIIYCIIFPFLAHCILYYSPIRNKITLTSLDFWNHITRSFWVRGKHLVIYCDTVEFDTSIVMLPNKCYKQNPGIGFGIWNYLSKNFDELKTANLAVLVMSIFRANFLNF